MDEAIVSRARGASIKGVLEQIGAWKATMVGDRGHPCPGCGGRDRFAVNLRKNIFTCRASGAGGDAIALLQHFDPGLSFRDACAQITGEVEPLSPSEPHVGVRFQQSAAIDRIGDALDIFRVAVDPQSTPVESFLRRRGVDLPIEAAGHTIRFHPDCPFVGHRTPAMVCLVRDILTNEPRAVHRTALNRDGNAIEIGGKKRAALGPVAGGAIKITPDVDIVHALGIGEGLESVLSLRSLPEFGRSPVWALISAGGVSTFPVLAGIESLWLAVDHDAAGERASRRCAERWRDAGREAYLVKPRAAGADLNDLRRGAA